MQIETVLTPDDIPSVNDPTVEPLDAYDGRPEDRVVLVTIDGESRVYPLRYLNYHEIVNDTLADTPIAVTWCPLCGSVLVFDRRVEGRTTLFGVSGKLADDTLVMYDHETESLWKQSLGRAIEGPLDGTELTLLPATTTTYAAAMDAAPDASVLTRPEPSETAGSSDERPAYDDDPYREYEDGDGFGLAAHRGQSEGRTFPLDWLDPKEPVVGVTRDGDACGFPRAEVAAAGGVVTATVGDERVLIVDAPDGMHAYRHPGGEATLSDDRLVIHGVAYDPTTGRAVEHDDRLSRLPASRLYAFGWHDNHGPSAFYRHDE